MTSDDDLLRAYDEQMRGISHSGRPGLIIERDGPLLRAAGQFRGLVTGPRDLGVDGQELDALIARQRDYFHGRGEAVEWKTRGHDQPADLPGRLRAAGFLPEDRETIFVGLAADMAAEPVLPAGVTLSRAGSEADFRAIGAMESEVWGQDWSFLADDLIDRTAAAPEDIAVFAASEARSGRVISAAWIVFYPGTDFAGLWGGSTVDAWRSRGIYRALIAARAQVAAARGTRYLQVDATDDSAPILRRLGFRAISTTTPYVWAPPA
ncbi:MAG TPA: GNAT family N-acetyltransferase [Trebonia sp.]|nr:GNAT family N-acetyltransferase [Trebonia sp.]